MLLFLALGYCISISIELKSPNTAPHSSALIYRETSVNEQTQKAFNLCDGHQAELTRIQEADALYEQTYNACADTYRAELLDAVLKGNKIKFGRDEYLYSPAGIIADEMGDEDLHDLVKCVVSFKAGRMSAERAMEILADRLKTALVLAGKSHADFKVGA
jgi:hypothetical protein